MGLYNVLTNRKDARCKEKGIGRSAIKNLIGRRDCQELDFRILSRLS